MRKILVMIVVILCSCGPSANDIGRAPKEDSFENRQKKQEELLRRQQEVIQRQERERMDLERQKLYDNQYRKFQPVQ